MGLDAVFEPVGPLPPGVYWRRRGLLLLVLVVLLLLVRSCAGGGGSDKKNKASVGASSPTPSTAAPSSSPSPSGPSVAACADTQLSLTATSDAPRYPSGAPARLTLTVKNTGPGVCTRDLSPAQFGFVVASGGVRTWSSNDCASPTPQVVALKANEVRSLTVPWNRHWSDTACSAATAQRIATPGTYTVKGVLGDLSQPGPTIVLTS